MLLILFWDHLSIEELQKYRNYTVLMIESYHDCRYHLHHKKKLVFLISAMRHFYESIRHTFDVVYIKTDLPIAEVAVEYARSHGYDKLAMIRPGEYRYIEELESLITVEIHENTQFISSISEFNSWADRQKQRLLMENFYREMRRKTGLLVENGKPVGGKWNFDKSNRNPMSEDVSPPELKTAAQDNITKDVINLVEDKFRTHFGKVEPFWMDVTREGALEQLEQFISYRLHNFGLYQDAMRDDSSFLFHSTLSCYLNAGLLSPSEVCKRVQDEYYKSRISIESAEGFIRQIIGWREFIRGIYWRHMPEYKELNHLEYSNPLPSFYWNAETDMECMKQVISSTIRDAYSHHIQRLMITGNFAAMTMVKPKEICEWYLIAYSDAHEWVELPNTLGMATYSDGGIVGTKPYIASGKYINKMSNFCKSCRYNCHKRQGDDACPFNYLYWNYLITHQKRLSKNHRMALVYAVLEKMSEAERQDIFRSAARFTIGMR